MGNGRRALAHNRALMGLSRALGAMGAGLRPRGGWRAFGPVRAALDGRLGNEGGPTGLDGADLLAASQPAVFLAGRNAVGGGAAGRRRGAGADAAAARCAHAGLGRIAVRADDYPAAFRLDTGAAPAARLPPHSVLPRGGLPLLCPGGYRQRADRTGQRLLGHPAVA